MDELKLRLRECGRFLELEDSIPYWEQQCRDQKIRIGELIQNREGKKWELDHLENPGFFRRLLGKTEEKKEKIGKQLREITAALNAAQWEQKDLEEKIARGKQELASLEGSRKRYLLAKEQAQLSTMEESQLFMEEIAAFAPAAIGAAQRVMEALEEARPWMQEDALRKGVRPSNRKMECLAEAQKNARRLTQILDMMPEGCASVGSYLREPGAYIDAVTSEYGRLDRLNNAIGQVQETVNQLRMLQ